MAEEIKDGTGTGLKVKVDNSNRLHTHGVAESLNENASKDGDSYNINTGTIALTSSTESALVYFKNNGDFSVRVSTIGFLIGNSTSGTGDLHLRVAKNVTGGTIISGATSVLINENKNTGSSQTLTGDAYLGVEGDTATGGTQDFYRSLLSGAARTYAIATGDIVIPKGGSIAVYCTPQTSNTAMNIQVFMAVSEYKLN